MAFKGSATGITGKFFGACSTGKLQNEADAPFVIACWINSCPSRVPARGTNKLPSVIFRLSNSTLVIFVSAEHSLPTACAISCIVRFIEISPKKGCEKSVWPKRRVRMTLTSK